MDIIYNILIALGCLIFGYLLGSISFSILIGKVFYHQDPREYGSKNAGGTNAGRLWGKKVGFLIIVLDMLKTLAPMWICWAILTYAPCRGVTVCAPTEVYFSGMTAPYLVKWPVYLLANVGCILGHCWPLFANFKGGKGVSNFMGTIIGASWGLGWVPAGLWYFPCLKKCKYVSLTSITMGIIASIFAWVWTVLVMTGSIPHGFEWIVGYGATINVSTWHYALIVTLMAGLMIARHHENIKKLREGTERKIKWMK